MTDERCDLETICLHEAGHGVMRWVRGLPCTELTANEDGGLCAGTYRPARAEDLLLVTLAGFAAESYCIAGDLDLDACRADDFDRAKTLIEHTEWMRIVGDPDTMTASVTTIEATIQRYWQRTCETLYPYMDIIERIAERLEQDRWISARSLAAMLRQHAHTQEHQP